MSSNLLIRHGVRMLGFLGFGSWRRSHGKPMVIASALAAFFSDGAFDTNAAPLPVASVTASADDGNVPANVLDGSLATRWSAQGDGQWIRFDLGTTRNIGA